LVMVALAMMAAGLPLAGVTLALSQMGHWSVGVLLHILSMHLAYRQAIVAGVAVFVALIWLVRRQLPDRLFWVAWWASWLGAGVALVLLCPERPCTCMPILFVLGPALLTPLRSALYKEVPSSAWCLAQCGGVAGAACVAGVAWSVWVLVGFPGRERWYDWPFPYGDLVLTKQINWRLGFVLWAAPLGGAMELGLLAVVYWVRHRYLSMVHQERENFIGTALKQLLGFIVALGLILWIGASISIAEEREDMREETILIAMGTITVLSLWTANSFDRGVLMATVSQSKVLQEVLNLLQGEWVQGFFLLVAALPLLLYLVAYRLAKAVSHQRRWPLVETLLSWNVSGVIVKAVWLGVAYVALFVVLGKATILLLVTTKAMMIGWSLWIVSFIMFLLALGLFLLPTSPAMPVYVLIGLVVTHSAEMHGWSWTAGVAWATFVASAMKLAFTAVAQKGIGEPLADNRTVRRLVCIHTPYMRAIEAILKENYSVSKVAVLIGGPDWPVAVLCGMLRLPLLPVLLCVAPVILQSVAPCVISGALLLHQHDAPAERRGGPPMEVAGLAEAALVLSGMLQFAFGIIACMCIQEVLEKDYDTFSEIRPEDAWLKEQDEIEEAMTKRFSRATRWSQLPFHTKAALIASLVCVQVGLALLCSPVHKFLGVTCFKEFNLMSSVEKDLRGDPLALVEPLGWLSLGLTVVAALGVWPYYAYGEGRHRSGAGLDDENTPLMLDRDVSWEANL